MSITIELPDEIAAHLATPEGMKWARKAVMDAYEELQSTEGAERDELIATVNAGIASIEAGERGYTPEEQDALMLEKFPFLKAHPADRDYLRVSGYPLPWAPHSTLKIIITQELTA